MDDHIADLLRVGHLLDLHVVQLRGLAQDGGQDLGRARRHLLGKGYLHPSSGEAVRVCP